MEPEGNALSQLLALLSAEVAAVDAYLLQAMLCEKAGYPALAQRFQEKWTANLGHVRRLLEHVDEGECKAQIGWSLGDDLRAQLQASLNLQQEQASRLRLAMAESPALRELLEGILENEESFLDFLEAQLFQIQELGYAPYLERQSGA